MENKKIYNVYVSQVISYQTLITIEAKDWEDAKGLALEELESMDLTGSDDFTVENIIVDIEEEDKEGAL